MSLRHYLGLGLLCASLSSASVSAQALCAKPLRIWEPLTPSARCLWQWLTPVLKEQHCPVEYVPNQELTPAGRRFEQVVRGEVDIAMGMARTADREGRVIFLPPYSRSEVRLYVRKGEKARWPIQSLCDAHMRKARLIAQKSGTTLLPYELRLRDAGCAPPLAHYHKTVQQGIEMLLTGRGEILLLSENAWRQTSAFYRARIEPLDIAVATAPVHMVMNKDTPPQIVAALSDVITRQAKQQAPLCGLLPPE